MLLAHQHLEIKESNSRLGFATTGGGAWKVWDRFITYDGEQLFHIGNVCGTCAFFFNQIKNDLKSSYTIEEVKAYLNEGILSLDSNLLNHLSKLLPVTEREGKIFGEYEALLLKISPSQARMNGINDYFNGEQLLLWNYGDDEVNVNVDKAYYRGKDSRITDTEKVFEFFIPLYQPEFLNQERVNFYREQIKNGLTPTAVSLGIVDAKESMIYDEMPQDGITGHWSFANYLLDGHHKIQAASLENQPITLISFISKDQSWQVIDTLLEFYKKKES